MSWFIDHAIVVYIVLLVDMLALFALWYRNQRTKLLIAACAHLPIIALFWLLTQLVVTDRQQIHRNVNAMADAVVNQDPETLFKHISKEFVHKGMTREVMHDRVARAIKMYKVKNAVITDFSASDVSRSDGKAKASFLVRVDDDSGGTVFFKRCETDFVLENDLWKLKGIEFFNPMANQDRPEEIPLP